MNILASLLLLAQAETGELDCMPYDMWTGLMVPQYSLELVDAEQIDGTADRLEYWASDNRLTTAEVIVSGQSACPVRTLVLSPSGERA